MRCTLTFLACTAALHASAASMAQEAVVARIHKQMGTTFDGQIVLGCGAEAPRVLPQAFQIVWTAGDRGEVRYQGALGGPEQIAFCAQGRMRTYTLNEARFANDLVSLQSVKVTWIDVRERRSSDAFADVALSGNWRATRALPAGRVLAARDVRPAHAVERGDRVSVTLREAHVAVVSTGVALSSANEGGRVLVRADKASSAVAATVKAPFEVEIR
jgi:flagella basal body P-ring formation protein FlgA